MGQKKIEVTVHQCRDVASVQVLGKQSPYLILRYGTQEFRSQTCEHGGHDPVFDETFPFVVGKDSTVLELTILADTLKKKGDVIGTATVDFVLALEQGSMRRSFPVTSAEGKPRGVIQVSISCPELVQAQRATQQMAAMQLTQAQEKHNQALVEARARIYPEVVGARVDPHAKVASRLAAKYAGQYKGVAADEEKEMASVLEETKPKAKGLIADTIEEYADITSKFLKEFVIEVTEADPSAKADFGREIQTVQGIVKDAEANHEKQLARAQIILLEGMDEVLNKYRKTVISANDVYSSTFQGALDRYKRDVEAKLRLTAEAKAQEEANQVAPAPAQPRASAPAPAPAAAHPPSHGHHYQQVPPNRAAYQPVPAPMPMGGMGGGMGMGMAYPAYSAPPSAPPPVAPIPEYRPPPPGVPLTKEEAAAAEAQRAKAEAAQAQAAAQRAQYEAEVARSQAAATQQQLMMEEEEEARRAAVRRGVVGGLIIGRALRPGPFI